MINKVLKLQRHEKKDLVFYSEITIATFHQILFLFDIEELTWEDTCDILSGEKEDREIIYYFEKKPLVTTVKRFFTEELRSKAWYAGPCIIYQEDIEEKVEVGLSKKGEFYGKEDNLHRENKL